MNQKILVSPSTFGLISNEPIKLLNESGFDYFINPHKRTLSIQETIELAKDCIGIVAGTELYDKHVLEKCTRLKCISRVGVGIENIDLEYASKKGIQIANTPKGPTQPVAELTLGLTLSLLRKIPGSHQNLKNGIWKKEVGTLLTGKTIGVIGLGNIGKTVSSIFKSLGNNVLAYDLMPDKEWATMNHVKLLDLKSLLQKADIITIHIPGSKDKKAVINSQLLNYIKPGAFLINVSRGGVVDEESLYELLKTEHIKGAAIDVYEKEPYNGPFLKLNNVVLTPHIGSYAAESKLQMEVDAVNNLIKALK